MAKWDASVVRLVFAFFLSLELRIQIGQSFTFLFVLSSVMIPASID